MGLQQEVTKEQNLVQVTLKKSVLKVVNNHFKEGAQVWKARAFPRNVSLTSSCGSHQEMGAYGVRHFLLALLRQQEIKVHSDVLKAQYKAAEDERCGVASLRARTA